LHYGIANQYLTAVLLLNKSVLYCSTAFEQISTILDELILYCDIALDKLILYCDLLKVDWYISIDKVNFQFRPHMIIIKKIIKNTIFSHYDNISAIVLCGILYVFSISLIVNIELKQFNNK
jgi:hypothetical protein